MTVHTDGASRGNPGQASIAFVIDGLTDQPIKEARAIGVFSNNQAEYQALIAALERLIEEDIRDRSIAIFMDSELVVRQLNGEYRVKNAELRARFQRAAELIGELKGRSNEVRLNSLRRERNSEADRLANQALDGKL